MCSSLKVKLLKPKWSSKSSFYRLRRFLFEFVQLEFELYFGLKSLNLELEDITIWHYSVGQGIFIPLVAMLRVNEAWIMTVVFLSYTARHLIKALASEPWLYYLGNKQ